MIQRNYFPCVQRNVNVDNLIDKWLLEIFAISTGFVTVLLLWLKVLRTLVEISFDVINDSILFQVLLILFQLDSSNLKNDFVCFFQREREREREREMDNIG